MSSLKSILVHVDASPRSVVRLQLAETLASRHDATLTGAYAATPAVLTRTLALGEGTGMMSTVGAEIDADNLRRARALFDQSGLGRRATWQELGGDVPVPAFIRAALTSDLLVLGQYDRSDAGGRIVPADFAEAVIIGSGKPAIVVPYAGNFSGTVNSVLVAWKPTRESARALGAALPLLQAAREVHVAAWNADPRDVEPWLTRHGVTPVFHSEPGTGAEVGELILSRAADLGAELLVMGCYGHSRTRELVLGGASRTIMDSMTVPVLMAH
jgi:nucleotide-binding universal stress UspA family protein